MKTPEQIAAEHMLSIMEYVPLDDAAMSHWTGAMVAAIEADRAQRRELLEREASILDDCRRGLNGYKVPEATQHNMSRASEAMRLAAGWDSTDAFRRSFWDFIPDSLQKGFNR